MMKKIGLYNNKKNKTTMKKFTKQEILELYGQVTLGEISFSRMVEIMNERVSEAEKPCVGDIPKRKFKKGDKVRIKKGISSKTNDNVDLSFVEGMDDLIGETMVVDGYTYSNNYVKCEGIEWRFHEEWLEPYTDKLKKGDLAIFWIFDKTQAAVRLFDKEQGDIFQLPIYVDNTGHWWANAIKFESKDQYERFISWEI